MAAGPVSVHFVCGETRRPAGNCFATPVLVCRDVTAAIVVNEMRETAVQMADVTLGCSSSSLVDVFGFVSQAMFKFNLLVQVPLWQTVCGKNHTAARNPDWTAYPCLANKAENIHQWRRRTSQSDICHRWALIEQHQVSGQVWPVDVQHCLQSTDKLYSSRSWTSFHKEAQTGTVQADGVCQVSWLVSNLVSCETHPCTFMHHYNHFTHFTLTLTCILVVQSQFLFLIVFVLIFIFPRMGRWILQSCRFLLN